MEAEQACERQGRLEERTDEPDQEEAQEGGGQEAGSKCARLASDSNCFLFI